MDPLDFIFILAVIFVVLFIVGNVKANEQATLIAKQVCHRNNLQFLDGTTALKSISVADFSRNISLQLVRNFRFEYSTNNVDRWYGEISIVDGNMQTLRLSHDVNNELPA